MLSAETLRQAIIDLREPVKFQGFQKDIPGANNPDFLRWDVDKFLDILGDKILPFRTGDNRRTLEPQWDIKCSIEEMTFSEFIEKTKLNNDTKWRYFDYKYMHQWLKERPEILSSIDWQRFGFDKSGNDSTLWIGSARAHTNCHQDSYGCNLVAQLHGKKQWLLFPPDAGNSIKPTRVPYEESTIYSKYNFFCPTKSDEDSIMRMTKKARLVLLEPGDVLLVPKGWWHYVESLDFTISINVWLPIDADYRERVKEALVKLLVANIGEEIPSASENEPSQTRKDVLDLIKVCVEEYKKHNESSSSTSCKRLKRTPWTAQELSKEYPNSVIMLPEMSSAELRELLINNRERFPENVEFSCNQDKTLSATFDIVNALCNYEVMNKVSDLLIGDK